MQECQDAVDKIYPCVNEAIRSMQQVNKLDIGEIRTLNRPPKVIKLILKVICMLLEV